MSLKQLTSKGLLLRSKMFTTIVLPHRTAVYHPRYLNPTISKDLLTEKIDPQDERHFAPIKAARIQESSSLFYDPLVDKFIGIIMEKGNREVAVNIVKRTFEEIKILQLRRYHKAKTAEEQAKIELNPRVVFEQALENCKPLLITQNVRRGGVTYKVPIPVSPQKALFKSANWIANAAMDKHAMLRIHTTMAQEMLNAARNEGKAIRMKQELHRLCEANRAYAQYRW